MNFFHSCIILVGTLSEVRAKHEYDSYDSKVVEDGKRKIHKPHTLRSEKHRKKLATPPIRNRTAIDEQERSNTEASHAGETKTTEKEAYYYRCSFYYHGTSGIAIARTIDSRSSNRSGHSNG
mmetsp:Transcript_55669/g.166763  ORF Transcript_55669/g.166763 Transcript_55669/m.166763 type:complete len:122 (-) Transcript_55669:829-1194(-)